MGLKLGLELHLMSGLPCRISQGGSWTSVKVGAASSQARVVVPSQQGSQLHLKSGWEFRLGQDGSRISTQGWL